MTELCRLAYKHGTDKAGVYSPFYDALLEWQRFGVRRVLEIGIGTPQAMAHVKNYQPGASLRMWRDYFPNAEIWGIDSDQKAMHEAGERIKLAICSQTDEAALHAHLGERKFDLIVDDGSHQPEDQLAAFQALRGRLDGRGLYIIEDVDELDALSAQIPVEHTAIQHHHFELTGRCILIYGNS